MENKFVTWLIGELNQRGWTNAELSRRANISHSMISLIISGQKRPGNDTCSAIAKAFNLSPEEVFRHAGLLPPLPSDDVLREQLLSYFDQLPDDDQERTLLFVRALVEARSVYHAKKRDPESETPLTPARAPSS